MRRAGPGVDPGDAQDAADDGGFRFFGAGDVGKRGAGTVAGEGGPGTGSLIARDDGCPQAISVLVAAAIECIVG